MNGTFGITVKQLQPKLFSFRRTFGDEAWSQHLHSITSGTIAFFSLLDARPVTFVSRRRFSSLAELVRAIAPPRPPCIVPETSSSILLLLAYCRARPPRRLLCGRHHRQWPTRSCSSAVVHCTSSSSSLAIRCVGCFSSLAIYACAPPHLRRLAGQTASRLSHPDLEGKLNANHVCARIKKLTYTAIT
jgi:hypothetical protein